MDKRIVVKVVAIVRAASLLVGQVTSRVALKDGGFEIIREYHLPILSTPRIPPSVPSSPSSSRIIPRNALHGVECTVACGTSYEEACPPTV